MVKNTHLWVILICVAVSFVLYGNSIPGEFVFDDGIFSENESFRSIGYIPTIWISPGAPGVPISGYRPLSYTSYAVNFFLSGPSPVGFHIVNILLHALMLFLIYLLIIRLSGRKDLALISLLLFAVLPIHTENIAFIKGRDDVISTVCAMLGWLFFLRAVDAGPPPPSRQRPIRRGISALLISAGCFFFAVTGKELIILVPAIYLGVWWISRRPPLLSVISCSLPYAAAMVIYAAIRIMVYGSHAFSKDFVDFAYNPLVIESFPVKVWTSFKIFMLYIQKTFIPYNLSMTHNYNHLTVVRHPLQSPEALIGILLFLVLFGIMLIRRRTDTMARIGALIFLISYITISKIIIGAADILAERWMYFPSLGLVLLAAVPLTWLFRRKPVAGYALFVPILLIYSGITVSRNLIWRSEKTAVENARKTAPNSIQTHYFASVVSLREGDLVGAEHEALAAYAIYPKYTRILVTLGNIAAAQNRHDIAMKYFYEATKTAPQDEEAHQYYALSLAKLGLYQQSIDHVIPQIRRRPTDRKLRYIMAVNYFKLGNIVEAKKYFDWTDALTGEQKIRRLEEY